MDYIDWSNFLINNYNTCRIIINLFSVFISSYLQNFELLPTILSMERPDLPINMTDDIYPDHVNENQAKGNCLDKLQLQQDTNTSRSIYSSKWIDTPGASLNATDNSIIISALQNAFNADRVKLETWYDLDLNDRDQLCRFRSRRLAQPTFKVLELVRLYG